jgi:hypothetical protein
MNGHFSLFFGTGMIRYLYSKVNLWKRKNGDRLLFWKDSQKKGAVAFFWTGTLYEDSALSLYGKSSLSPFLLRK